MVGREIYRVRDIVEAIDQIDLLVADLGFPEFLVDKVKRAAFERFVEIISEASRHLPESLKQANPAIKWRNMADIGNHLRHAYHRADAEILWNLHDHGHLHELRTACVSFLSNQQ